MVVAFIHRLISFTFSDKSNQFDFASTYAKIAEAESRGSAYSLVEDNEQFSVVIQEILGKGLFTLEFQLLFLNFCIFWYFTASFLIQTFALLYYRKFREN